MPPADWLSTICIVGMLVVVAVVAVDRNRLKHRLNNAEGRVTGLSLDLDAVRDRVAALTAYLNEPANWDVDATPPANLTASSHEGGRDPKHRTTDPLPAAADAPQPRPGAVRPSG